jgi:hypothetical protein
MSVKTSSLVWEARLQSQQKLILLAFADVADDQGYCVFRKDDEITIASLAYKTSLGERTIQRQIAEMLDPDTGFLEITREAKHHSPREYRIRIERLAGMNRITRGDKVAPLDHVNKAVEKSGQGCQIGTPQGQSGVTSTTVRGDIHDSQGCHPRHPTYKVLDVKARKGTSLSRSLTTAEREMVMKDLKSMFPTLGSLPSSIPPERAFLFLHKVRMGEIRKEQLYSPVAYMIKLADEDITLPLAKWRAAQARRGG